MSNYINTKEAIIRLAKYRLNILFGAMVLIMVVLYRNEIADGLTLFWVDTLMKQFYDAPAYICVLAGVLAIYYLLSGIIEKKISKPRFNILIGTSVAVGMAWIYNRNGIVHRWNFAPELKWIFIVAWVGEVALRMRHWLRRNTGEKTRQLHDPITSLGEDLFNRGPYVKSIVANIERRVKIRMVSCETIGVYGKWGEGKSSVIELVKSELKECYPYSVIDNPPKGRLLHRKKARVKVIDFNPWFFNNQESILMDFFKLIQKSVSDEHLAKLLNKYGNALALSAEVLAEMKSTALGMVVGKIVRRLLGISNKSEKSVHDIKKEIDEVITLSGYHFVIFIDDVDRLDSDELHLLFKLIKQTADFVNTTYVVAMDIDMVASSIGDRFESGNPEAGRNFIEKIVQYPRPLPMLQKKDLSRLLVNSLNSRLNAIVNEKGGLSLYNLSEDVIREILPLFSTAREVLLFVDSFTFSYSFLHEEVHFMDFLRLEALRMFHHEGYQIIYQNKDIITQRRFTNKTEEQKEEYLVEKKFIETVCANASTDKKIIIRNIANNLLRPLISSFEYSLREPHKRLVSHLHFDRYFTLYIQDDIVKEYIIDDLKERIETIDESQLIIILESIYRQFPVEELERVAHTVVYTYNDDESPIDGARKICLALGQLPSNDERNEFDEAVFNFEVEQIIIQIINTYMYRYSNTSIRSRYQDYDTQISVLKEILHRGAVNFFKLFLAVDFINYADVYHGNEDEVDRIVTEYFKKLFSSASKDKVFRLSIPAIFTLFKTLKNNSPEWYMDEYANYILQPDFELQQFLKVVFPTVVREGKTYHEFKDLFDVEAIYKEVKPLIKGYDSSTVPKELEGVFNFSVLYNSK